MDPWETLINSPPNLRPMGHDYDLIIIGGGPAGSSAAVYAVRAGLNVLVIEGKMGGGLVTQTPAVENFPSIPLVGGTELGLNFVKHAQQYTEVKVIEPVERIEKLEEAGFSFKVITANGEYTSRTVMIATGTHHRELKAPGVREYAGKGVSYCATCDGFFFRDRKVVVVGGGSAALTEALYLAGIKCDVTIIHRRDKVRGEEKLFRRCLDQGIKFQWDSVVTRVHGEMNVDSVEVENVKTGEGAVLPTEGVFVAIGLIPQVDLATSIGAGLDEEGYIRIDRFSRTNVPGLYAAGDVTGGIRQIVVAAAEGASGALTAKEDITDL